MLTQQRDGGAGQDTTPVQRVANSMTMKDPSAIPTELQHMIRPGGAHSLGGVPQLPPGYTIPLGQVFRQYEKRLRVRRLINS